MLAPFLALLLMSTPAADPTLAVVGRPAVVHPVVEAQARCSANPQVTVSVTGFQPAHAGHVTLVVSLQGADGRRTELGRVGVFPEQGFSGSLHDAQRFGFALPKGGLDPASRVVVELAADAGGGHGAFARVGEARIAPAPSEKC